MKANSVIIFSVVLIGLSSCSFLTRISDLEPERIRSLNQVDAYKPKEGNWINFSSNTYTCYADSSFECAFGTILPEPTISFGPPFLPVIPNFYYFGYRLFGSDHQNFFVNFIFWSKKDSTTLNLSKIHFYDLKNKEIVIDTVRFIPREHWSLLESEISSIYYLGKSKPETKIIRDTLVSISSLNYVRFNLKINSYQLKDGLIIRFDEGFMNKKIDLPEIKLTRKNKYHFEPFIFGS